MCSDDLMNVLLRCAQDKRTVPVIEATAQVCKEGVGLHLVLHALLLRCKRHPCAMEDTMSNMCVGETGLHGLMH